MSPSHAIGGEEEQEKEDFICSKKRMRRLEWRKMRRRGGRKEEEEEVEEDKEREDVKSIFISIKQGTNSTLFAIRNSRGRRARLDPLFLYLLTKHGARATAPQSAAELKES